MQVAAIQKSVDVRSVDAYRTIEVRPRTIHVSFCAIRTAAAGQHVGVVRGEFECPAVVFDRPVNLALPLVRSCATCQGDGQVSLRHASTSYHGVAAPDDQLIAKTAVETLLDIGVDALAASHLACRGEDERQNDDTQHG